MNEQNIEYLANEMFYTGFGEIPKEKLVNAIQEATKDQKEGFQLVHDTKFGKDSVRALLNFKQSSQTPGMFFYNSFDLLVKKEGKEETLQQNFSASYGNKYTLKEGYNLLDGRSVNKNLIKFDKEDKENKKEYNAWVSIDFKDNDKYGNFLLNKTYHFDLEKKVAEYPIKGMEYQQNKNQLLDSLKKGNRAQIMLTTSRGDEKMYIEAAPKFNSLNFFDENMKPIRLSVKEAKEENISNNQNESQELENGKSQETSAKTAQDKKDPDDKPAKKESAAKTTKRRMKA